MYQDFEGCVRAVRARDARFDGWFFVAVSSTRIYCRPSCPAPPSKVRHYTFFATAAAAQRAGYRACKRCRPDASPGSPEWSIRADVVGRAMRLIRDGVVDREGVWGLTARLGYSQRQLERLLLAELGAGPLALARAQRAQTARMLIESTTLRMAEIAMAAGFASIRSFNDTVRSVFAMTPSQLRQHAIRGTGTAVGAITVRLPFRTPFSADCLLSDLAMTAIPGLEHVSRESYRRALRLPHGRGIVTLEPHTAHVDCHLAISDLQDLGLTVSRCRWMLDLDADPVAADQLFSRDPRLAPLVSRHPGRRVPHVVDGAELVTRLLLGPPSARATRRRLAQLVAQCGEQVEDTRGAMLVFPSAQTLAAQDPAVIGVPTRSRGSFTALLNALAEGSLDLDVGSDWTDVRASLSALPGVTRLHIDQVGHLGLGDPDAFPIDQRVTSGARTVGLPRQAPRLRRRAEAWRPWRAYAAQHLASLGAHVS
ncbi:MAG TPA: AlkA N-terminal domain-containing protein [Intrasporangium sp.]|uniref:DNA-3-methyladenine glycosylase 2 family protein n=1 Tax=Intrasporangium sp. TaxID=1925024 RepID=UPI002B4A7E18|nr:AlkA N-terminal domain-containing protein [Intrasporangium sp.]HKX66480.1 AlkA N-terminal domain-containing protein [Intrasporangium sp.]